MKYNYKSIILKDMDSVENHQLNDKFEDGWEYVDSTAQHISSGSSGYGKKERL